jgi:hypothetical protein
MTKLAALLGGGVPHVEPLLFPARATATARFPSRCLTLDFHAAGGSSPSFSELADA